MIAMDDEYWQLDLKVLVHVVRIVVFCLESYGPMLSIHIGVQYLASLHSIHETAYKVVRLGFYK